jgi:putative addiction module component (TIGR02574 family)
MSVELSEILKLSISERILLVEAIWDSIADETVHGTPYDLSEDQVKILEEELAAYKKNPAEGAGWDEIKKRILHRK